MEATHTEETSLGKTNSGPVAWNLLTVLLLAGVVLIAGLSLLIYLFPHSVFNPFPFPTLPAALLLPTQSPTPRVVLPPTWTPTPLVQPAAMSTTAPASATAPDKTRDAAGFSTSTPAQRPTQTRARTASPTPTRISTRFPTPSPTQDSTLTPTENSTPHPDQVEATEAAAATQARLAEYAVQSGNPMAMSNVSYPDLGCNWMGVGGQVVDANGNPVKDLKIQLGGELDGVPISATTFSRTGNFPHYGPAGYEFSLAKYPIASTGSLWVQVLGSARKPLSERIPFNTYDDCDSNLIIINFEQAR